MSKQETIQYFEDRIKTINEQENHMKISYCLVLERDYCKEMLKKMKEEDKTQNEQDQLH